MIVGGIPLLLGGGGGNGGGGDITAGITYAGKSVLTTASTGQRGAVFNTAGTELLLCGDTENEVNQWTLSTPWDISTATFTGGSSVSAQSTDARFIAINTDGTKLFLGGLFGDIYRYSMSPGFDVSTLSYDTNTFDTTILNTGCFISEDGLKFFTMGGGGLINSFTMSVAFDLTTMDIDAATFDFGAAGGFGGLNFSSDGLRAYTTETSDGLIYQANLTVPWDIATAGLIGTVDPLQGGNTYAGVWIDIDNNRLMLTDLSSKKIFQFSFDDLP